MLTFYKGFNIWHFLVPDTYGKAITTHNWKSSHSAIWWLPQTAQPGPESQLAAQGTRPSWTTACSCPAPQPGMLSLGPSAWDVLAAPSPRKTPVNPPELTSRPSQRQLPLTPTLPLPRNAGGARCLPRGLWGYVWLLLCPAPETLLMTGGARPPAPRAPAPGCGFHTAVWGLEAHDGPPAAQAESGARAPLEARVAWDRTGAGQGWGHAEAPVSCLPNYSSPIFILFQALKSISSYFIWEIK